MKPRSSATIIILKALIPYSKESFSLGFNPNKFFNQLEKADRYDVATLRTSFYRAQRQGFITRSTKPKLTKLGKEKIRPYIATKLINGGKLMVIFDIPQTERHLRRVFRNELRRLGFRQIQQSVWLSSYDHRATIRSLIKDLGLGEYVQIYEAAKL